jgi:hypothetical protein
MNDNNLKKPGEPENGSLDDEIIDLIRVARKGDAPGTGGSGIDEAEQLPDAEIEPDDFDEEDLDIGQLVAEVIGGDASAPSDFVTIPLKQLEEVLEKVIQKAYSDKIEVLVMNMVEKTINTEIEKINALIWKIVHENEEEPGDEN